MAELCFPFPCHLLFLTSLLPLHILLLSLFGAAEPVGSVVAQGTGLPGWSLRTREETHLPALGQGPLCSLPGPAEVGGAQESQDPPRGARGLSGHRPAAPGPQAAARQGWQEGSSSRAEGSQVKPSLSLLSLLFLDTV